MFIVLKERAGPFGANCLAYLPVCLNSLLFKLELDIARIFNAVDPLHSAEDQYHWNELAERRRAEMYRYHWDAADACFYDYDWEKRERRRYCFGTCFLPLWVGLASPDQVRPCFSISSALTLLQVGKMVPRVLEKLAYPGGLSTSDVAMETQVRREPLASVA